jgi:UDP-N-acetylmuramoyl-tripeptide--D-alanyl-D-alanine ligase
MKTMLAATDLWEGLRGLLVAARSGEGETFSRGVIDSREAAPGDLFFALQGERSDGHDFVADALSAGAAGAVVDRPVPAPPDAAVFQVADTLTALQRLAAYRRARHDVRVVGVTGSVGKTTCKEIIAGVMSRRFSVLKTEANLNTEIGVPLTLLQLRDDHQRAVLELGMYQPGDIALLAEICRPSVGVVTNVGPVHLERAGSIGRITSGKAELVGALPADGLAVLNGDDTRVASMARQTRARTVLYGLSGQCDVRAGEVRSHGLDGFSFRLHAGDESADVYCALPGKHHVYPALAAAAVALNEGMSVDEVAEALGDVRLDLRLTVRPGPHGSTIIDDSYNASPASMTAALDLLSETAGRRIALLGHMRELGPAEAQGHAEVGRYAAGKCEILFVSGAEARPLADAAKEAGHPDVRLLETAEEAASALLDELREGDVALIKASRAVGLENVVAALGAR